MERANISVADLSLSQKLDLMKSIWDELSKDSQSLQSPGWHEDVLRGRESAFERGQVNTTDWADAKKRIKRNLGCG